jgi:septal ring-binding cell division protein DamX
MSNPLYLTPQTAMLMKNFSRVLNTGASVIALYGEPCTGKTRILHELAQNQMPKSRVRWIEINARDSGDEAKQDRSELIEATFDLANDGDFIIVDHLESAFNKTCHQLFLSWTTTGIEKNLKLIIACNIEVSNDLEQLVQHYQVRIKSFQLMPFNDEQVEAFIGFYLFPDHPTGKLVIPGDLRVKFSVTHGRVGQIIEIAKRDGARISSGFQDNIETTRQDSRMVAVLGVSVLAMAVGWFFLSGGDDKAASTPIVASDSSNLVASIGQVAETGIVTEAEVETVDEAITERESGTEIESIKPSATKTTPETGTVLVSVRDSDAVSATDLLIDAQEQTRITQEPGNVADVSKAVEEDIDTAGSVSDDSSVDELEQNEVQRLQRELRASSDWIYNNEGSVGTIQILLLSFEKFDAKGFFEHVDYLANHQVDTAKLRIFKTYSGNMAAYSVFYGEYGSRIAASSAKDSLPEVLRKTSPISRSLGGIIREIRRLEAMS